jgi:hypothetical protein
MEGESESTEDMLARHEAQMWLSRQVAAIEEVAEDRGVGTQLSCKQGRVVFTNVLPGSAAHEAGIRPGDAVISVDGKSVGRSTRGRGRHADLGTSRDSGDDRARERALDDADARGFDTSGRQEGYDAGERK